MATIGYATLSVIPSLQNAQSALERQAKGPMAAAGRAGGKQYGRAAGTSAGSSFKNQFQKNLKGLAGPLTAAFAGLSAKKLLGDSVKAFTDLNLQVVQFRRLTGGSVEDASRLRSAVQLSGVDITKAGASLTIFSKNLGKAAGDEKKTAATTALLGTSFVDANGQVESLTTLLPRVAEKFSQMEDGVAKTTLATTLFGRAGVAMIPFLNKGAAGIAELTAQSDKLGLTLTQTDLDSFGEYRTASRELQASFQGLKVEAGRELLPTLTSLTTFTTKNAIPALKDLGSAARGVYEAYSTLPGPLKDAAKAFVALRLASAIGLTALATGAVAATASAFTTLRLQVMFAGDAYRTTAAKSGSLTAALAALRAGSAGAGAALASLARVALPIAAITAGITLWGKYAKSQEDAKARVEALKASLDQQTGALTKNSTEVAAQELEKAGVLKTADKLGISLGTITQAYLGNSEALKVVQRATAGYDKVLTASNAGAGAYSDEQIKYAQNSKRLADSFKDLRGDTDSAVAAQRRQIEATRDANSAADASAGSSDAAAASTKKYSTEIDKARYALQKLINKEKERVEQAAGRLGDRISIQQAILDAQKSLAGAQPGFDLNLDPSAGGQKNIDRLNALKSISDAFNQADPKVQNAPGVYQQVRDAFDQLAIQAGASADEVTTLRDELLLVPKTATTDFRTPGLRQALSDVDRLIAGIDKLNANPRSLVPLYRADRADAVSPSPKPGPSSKRGGSAFDLGAGGLNANGRGPTVYQFNGPVTYTDEEEGRRRARNHDRRTSGDNVRRNG